jgi:hypothetical protein
MRSVCIISGGGEVVGALGWCEGVDEGGKRYSAAESTLGRPLPAGRFRKAAAASGGSRARRQRPLLGPIRTLHGQVRILGAPAA